MRQNAEQLPVVLLFETNMMGKYAVLMCMSFHVIMFFTGLLRKLVSNSETKH